MFQWKEVFPAKMALLEILDNALEYTGIPRVRLHQKYPAFARSPVQDSGPHFKKQEMWQLQRKLFSRRNKAHNHLQLWIPGRQRHPSLWNSRVASLVTRFTVIWSASPQATMVFWRGIINWERHRITATSEHFLGGFCSLPEKKNLGWGDRLVCKMIIFSLVSSASHFS